MFKNNLKVVLIASIAAFVTFSCNNQKETTPEVNEEHSAQNSLDWQGSYSGTLPCADCEGIYTELSINDSMDYTLITKYLGVENESADTLSGKFTWEGNNIRLGGIKETEGSSLYKVEENRVRHLDLEGKAIEGDLAENYILSKDGNPEVENKRWKLVEIYGKPVKESSDTHYLIFHSNEKRLEAKAGCNQLSLNYTIKNSLQLSIQEGLSTLMACENDTLEKELLQIFQEADNLSTDGKSLSINKARMAPLARFELVNQ
ncbi:MAG: copper resistance protein NlpE N-terminal domain-containing protein [Chitinophagales bacterium]|nr:copper resistance protein NlpE N-terminal domain-containing protein [Chitinophagales bacterium]